MWSPDVVQTDGTTNLFASWEGTETADGIFIDLPFGWGLEDLRLLRRGYQPIAVQISKAPLADNRYIIVADQPLRGHHELVLHVETSASIKSTKWSVIPFTRRRSNQGPSYEGRMAFAVSKAIRTLPPAAAADNQALAFREGDQASLLVRQAALPDLGTQAPFTVEFWMRTQRFEEIVLSTWNGDERQPYPMEFVIDASGRLLYYRGQPGQHQSMTTGLPVADGQWHHISLTNDPETRWTRLFVDGAAVDSLYSMDPLNIALDTPIALGGRAVATPEEDDTSTESPYTGLLDEVRFWPRVQSVDLLQAAMRQPLQTEEGGAVVLGFDDRLDPRIIERFSSRTRRVASDLHFFHPVRNLSGTAETGFVTLAWETEDRQTKAFIVERSRDGRVFEEVGQVRPQEQAVLGMLSDSYQYQDLSASGQILFYRVRQQFSNGASQLSQTIKMGLGEEEPEQALFATLVGNFPNPFNPTTTITYDVKERVHVQLSVWDLSGQQLTRLVDTEKEPGTYEVSFEANDLPSGTYFVRLQTPDGIQSHKMILTK